MSDTASVNVRRPAMDAGWARKLNVRINGQVVARLKPGAAATVTIAPGEHSLDAYMDWQGSEEYSFTVDGSQAVEFEVSLPMAAVRKIFSRKGVEVRRLS